MQPPERCEQRIFGRRGLDRTHLQTESGHAQGDKGLRDCGQGDHEDDEGNSEAHMERDGSRLRGCGHLLDGSEQSGSGTQKAGGQEDYAAEDSAKVHAGKGVPDDGAGGVSRGKHRESARGDNEAEEDVGTEPKAYAEEFDGAKHECRVAEEVLKS